METTMHFLNPIRLSACAAAVLTCAPAVAVTLVLELPASRDATIYANATGFANGAGASFLAGTNGSGQARRALLGFDLGSVSPGATVLSASLSLYADQVPNATARSISLRALQQQWTEGPTDAGAQQGQGVAAANGDVTWASAQHPSTPWTTPGGTFGASSATTIVAGVGLYTWSSTDAGNDGMRADVQRWLDDPSTNFGWALVGVETGTSTVKRFVSSEGDAGLVPLLRLEIAPVPEPSTWALLAVGLVATLRAGRSRIRPS
jgi:hypothetical protein